MRPPEEWIWEVMFWLAVGVMCLHRLPWEW